MAGNQVYYPSDYVAVAGAIDPQLVDAAAVTSDWVSLKDFASVMFVVSVGATDIEVDAKIQSATDSSGTGADDITNLAITQIADDEDDGQVILSVDQSEVAAAGDTHVAVVVTVGDGSTGAGVAPTHTYIAGGGYTVTLVVNDGKVNSTPDTTTAYISEINDSPVADAGPEQTVSVGETVTFDGSGSYDIDDGIVAYSWEFGDGATGSGETTTHTYTDAGIYQVTLTVTDAGDLTTTDIKTVNVTEEPTLVMHVEKVEMELSTRTAGRNKFTKALATVTIVDASDNPVVGVTVHGSWSSATSDIDSGITDVTGKVTLESNEVKNAFVGTTFEFTVDDVVGADWIYNNTDNITSGSIISAY